MIANSDYNNFFKIYVSALFVINQVFANAFEIPLYLQMIIGLLPVALTWAAANIKAQTFGLLGYYKKSIRLYERELLLPFGEEEDWLEEQEYEDKKLDFGIQILLRETIDENIPTSNAAEYLFERDNAQENKKIYQYRQDQKISKREQQYQEDKASLDASWDIKITKKINEMRSLYDEKLDKMEGNFNPDNQNNIIDNFNDFIDDIDLKKAQDEIIRKCQKDKEEEKPAFDIKQIESEYAPLIKAYDTEEKKAQKKRG